MGKELPREANFRMIVTPIELPRAPFSEIPRTPRR
jgi:hypothetical protein